MKITAEKNRYDGDTGWESDAQLFAKVTVTWKQWLGQAADHLRVAEVLLPEERERDAMIRELMAAKVRSAKLPRSVTDAYFLHCALAIENSLKGIIASVNSIVIEQQVLDTQTIPKTLLGHDLVDLAARADIQVDFDDEFALAFLTRYGFWGGKYPLPTSNRHNALTTTLSDGNHYLVGGYNPDIVPSFVTFAHDIYVKARTDIESLEQASAAGPDALE